MSRKSYLYNQINLSHALGRRKTRIIFTLLTVLPVLAAVWLGDWTYEILFAYISYEVSSMALIHPMDR